MARLSLVPWEHEADVVEWRGVVPALGSCSVDGRVDGWVVGAGGVLIVGGLR